MGARKQKKLSRWPPGVTYVTCGWCGKRGYPTRPAAKRAAGIIQTSERLRVYSCGNVWHITSVPLDRTVMYRERRADAAGGGGSVSDPHGI